MLYVRGQGENVRLLLSANPGHPRANLTTLNRENPEQPPMFCMLLRKHLQGARILELNQPPLERILEFRLETLEKTAREDLKLVKPGEILLTQRENTDQNAADGQTDSQENSSKE